MLMQEGIKSWQASGFQWGGINTYYAWRRYSVYSPFERYINFIRKIFRWFIMNTDAISPFSFVLMAIGRGWQASSFHCCEIKRKFTFTRTLKHIKCFQTVHYISLWLLPVIYNEFSTEALSTFLIVLMPGGREKPALFFSFTGRH